MRFRSWATTHRGTVRAHNEDRLVDRPDLGLWAVADGAGGHEAGEVAAEMIAASLETIPSGLDAGTLLAELRLRIAQAHSGLRSEAAKRGPHATMATTLVVLIARDSHFACLWVGDSRAYLLRGAEFLQITRDHSLVQDWIDAGVITAEQAESHPQANVITRAIGAGAQEVEIDKTSGRLQSGDRFLLCSDGLSKTLSQAVLANLLAAPSGIAVTDVLVAAALDKGANDNVTAVAIDVE